MTHNEKELLLKDLCARLPYGVKGRVYAECSNGEYDMNGDMIFFDSPFDVTLDNINISTEELHVIAIGNEDTIAFIEDQQTWGSPYTVDGFKPYLRPMSSMTTDEEYEYHQIRKRNSDKSLSLMDCNDHLQQLLFPIIVGTESIDWLNKKMFDYKGLIHMNLALEAPNGMYK